MARLRDYVIKWLEDALTQVELETLRRISVFRGPVPFDALHTVMYDEKREELLIHRIALFERLGVVARFNENFVVHDLVREALSNSSSANSVSFLFPSGIFAFAICERDSWNSPFM